jgi:hypothetical protein
MFRYRVRPELVTSADFPSGFTNALRTVTAAEPPPRATLAATPPARSATAAGKTA